MSLCQINIFLIYYFNHGHKQGLRRELAFKIYFDPISIIYNLTYIGRECSDPFLCSEWGTLWEVQPQQYTLLSNHSALNCNCLLTSFLVLHYSPSLPLFLHIFCSTKDFMVYLRIFLLNFCISSFLFQKVVSCLL